jgi:hypothetical protein
LRGGSFNGVNGFLLASSRGAEYHYCTPTYESYYLGFRVSEVPEPGSIVMLSLAGVGILRRKRA